MQRPDGYEPRYLRASAKHVAFDLPGAGGGKDKGLAGTPGSRSEDSAGLSEGTKAQRKASAKAEHEIRERARERKRELEKKIANRQNKGEADQDAGEGEAGGQQL